ncbi:3675_t:CDS:2 [Ambispora leptoticha]|uniref:3675_t:CDS:1 n=1 Tax=Ambispora leptoticha TaxID=144679 RepID=A0A9N8VD59_9GLOM|nr:3675_t:CDS:2 [Ambispora leptoticha]
MEDSTEIVKENRASSSSSTTATTPFDDFDGINPAYDLNDSEATMFLKKIRDIDVSSFEDEDEEKESSRFVTTIHEPIVEADSDIVKILVSHKRSSGDYSRINYLEMSTDSKSLQSPPQQSKKRTFMLATDLSSESLYAFEWAVKNVLRPESELYIVSVLEEDKPVSGTSNSISSPNSSQTIINERLEVAQKIAKVTRTFLDNTRFPVSLEIQVVTAKSTRTMLTNMIDLIKPTLVIAGSRGLSSIKGMFLGSISTYLVQNSSVPVMVARQHTEPKRKKRSADKKKDEKLSLIELRESVKKLEYAGLEEI